MTQIPTGHPANPEGNPVPSGKIVPTTADPVQSFASELTSEAQSRIPEGPANTPTDSRKNLEPLVNILLCWLVLMVLVRPQIIAPYALIGYARSLIHMVERLPLLRFDGPRAAVSDSQIIRLRRAIIGQESGANFRAINPHSGALGYGQVMPDNVPVWTEQALGRSLTTSEFLNDPDAQIATIDYKLQQYWQEAQQVTQNEDEIVRRIASKWYSGNHNLWKNTSPQYYNGYAYPSIASYTYNILLRYREAS